LTLYNCNSGFFHNYNLPSYSNKKNKNKKYYLFTNNNMHKKDEQFNIMEKHYYKNIDMTGKKVVARFDFNVPMNNGTISDDFRITSAMETIKHILEMKPTYLILVSHFGRPKGREEKYSLAFLVPVLEKYLNLNKEVFFLREGIHPKTLEILENGTGVYLLENIRFHEEETCENALKNDLIGMYEKMGDIFLCDAFGCLHREHMSICGPAYFNKPYCYGDLIKKECECIDQMNQKNQKTLAIIGGNKIKDKLPIINSLRTLPNSSIFVAGGLAKQYKEKHENVFLMSDGYGGKNMEEPKSYIDDIHSSELHCYDIGDKSLEILKTMIKDTNVVFWNGSLGVIENEQYRKGSLELIEYLHTSKQFPDKVIIGGGETASLIPKEKCGESMYVSTGGGALLEYLENKILYGNTLVGLIPFCK
jgi:phosphoglycerate kinase